MRTDYRFVIDDTGGILLLFVSTSQSTPSGNGSPLWRIEFADEDHRNAMCAWLGARRTLWPAWGRMAEEEGGPAVERHVMALVRADPPEIPRGVMLSPEGDSRALTFSVTFPSRRRQPVVRHRFRSAAALRRFVLWFNSNGNHRCGWDLARIGLLCGGPALGELFDDIAKPLPLAA